MDVLRRIPLALEVFPGPQVPAMAEYVPEAILGGRRKAPTNLANKNF